MARLENLFGVQALAVVDRIAASDAVSSQDAALVTLLAHPDCGIGWLAGVVGLTDSGATRLVERLVASGLVRRRAGADARSRTVRLTAAGRRQSRRVLAARSASSRGASSDVARGAAHPRAVAGEGRRGPDRRPVDGASLLPALRPGRLRERPRRMPAAAHGAGRRAAMNRLLVPAGVGMIAVAFGLARYGFGLLLPDMRASLVIDAATAGLVGSSAYVSYLVANALVVALTVRTGPRVPLLLATGCAVGGMATIAGADSVSSLALGVLLAGASAGFAFPPYADVVAGAVPERRRSTAWASISSGTGWGVAVAGPVAVVAGAEWRTAWWVFAALALVVGSTAVSACPRVRAAGPGERSASGRAGSCARSRGRCCCPRPWWASAARSGGRSASMR